MNGERMYEREHGLTEADLLLAHRPTFAAPTAEVVCGLAIIKHKDPFPSMPHDVRVKLKRLAADWLNEQLGLAWQFCLPPSKHNVEADVCQRYGHPEEKHPFRHPFVAVQWTANKEPSE